MATTTNFGWDTPDDTDYVTDGAAAMRELGQDIDTTLVDLKGGTTGQMLTKNSNTDMDFVWASPNPGDITGITAGTGISGGGTSGDVTITNSMATAIDAKGDLIVGTGADAFSRLAVGTNGQVPVADSTTATGLKYEARATLAANTFTADQTINGLTVGRGASGLGANTAVGIRALNSITTGNANTAIGEVAGDDITTGNDNTAIGAGALNSNVTGSENVAVGRIALQLTTGSFNTAVGPYIMTANTTGANNVAMGRAALTSNTTANENTAIGVFALNANTTGTVNTAIGSGAADNLTTGSNNSALGYQARPSSATVSNTITLGNSSISTLRCQVTSITSLSDRRDKKDIAPLEHGLDFVKQLKPVSFEWNTRPEIRTDYEGNEVEVQGKVGIADIGFIAQDIVALEDSLGAADSLQLSFRDNPEKLEVTQGRLIPILVKAIQDLTAKVEALELIQLNLAAE